jgi:hypothetical protein
VTLYRDPLTGLRSQVATKRGALASREGELRPLFRAMLPERLRRTLADLGPRAEADANTLEDLSDADGALDGLLAAHDEAVSLVPRLRECPDDVRDPARPDIPPPWVIEEAPQLRFRAVFDARVHEISPEAYLVRWGDHAYLTRLRLAGAPVVALARVALNPSNNGLAAQGYGFRGLVRTSIHPAAPPLRVRPQGLLQEVAKVLHLARDRKIGEEVFDDAFMVDTDEAGATLLSADVVAAFRALADAAPSLRVANGIVELTWGGAFGHTGTFLLPDAALDVVLGVRAALERA